MIRPFRYDLLEYYQVYYCRDGETYTEGLKEHFKHSELRIVAPISPRDASIIFNRCTQMIVEGEYFEEGAFYSGIVSDTITFIPYGDMLQMLFYRR